MFCLCVCVCACVHVCVCFNVSANLKEITSVLLHNSLPTLTPLRCPAIIFAETIAGHYMCNDKKEVQHQSVQQILTFPRLRTCTYITSKVHVQFFCVHEESNLTTMRWYRNPVSHQFRCQKHNMSIYRGSLFSVYVCDYDSYMWLTPNSV